MKRSSRWRRALVWVAVLSLAPVLAELAVRAGLVRPVRQVIRGHGLRSVGDVPVWLGEEPGPRENRACVDQHPDWTRILFFGSSVAYGEYVRADETFPWLLEKRLNAAGQQERFCVLNFSSPGFLHEQRMARAREELPRYRPDIVFYQDNDMEWSGTSECHASTHYRLLGDEAYDIGALELRADGFPGLFGVPTSINHYLFLRSQFYRYLVLARGESVTLTPECRVGNPDQAWRKKSSKEFIDLARSFGAKPVFLVAADLTHSLKEPTEFELRLESPLLSLGREEGVPIYIVQRELADQNYREIGKDFRHFNPRGHELVAERLERFVLRMGQRDGPP